ncbi:MAG: hypothetical protein CMI18_01505 [Opitutaceae bacterium]|nr:hypothetical protein [Opitutaceae bacterium]
MFSINARSLLMLTLELGPDMIERGGGSIVNISSAAASLIHAFPCPNRDAVM